MSAFVSASAMLAFAPPSMSGFLRLCRASSRRDQGTLLILPPALNLRPEEPILPVQVFWPELEGARSQGQVTRRYHNRNQRIVDADDELVALVSPKRAAPPMPGFHPKLPADATDGNDPHPCPHCGGRMIIIETFERGSMPRHRPKGPTGAILFHLEQPQLLEYAQENTKATFDFFQQLSGVKSPTAIIELSTEHARNQFARFTEQTKQLTSLAQSATHAVAEPIKTGVENAFEHVA
jgi:hypothetical protein